MKNMKKIILSLSLVGAFTLCEQEPKKVAFNINNIVATVQTKSKELVDTAETAGRYVDNGLMAFPYYIGSFFGGAASTVKIMAGYAVQLPFRWVGNGIDGLFGDGTVAKMGSVTKGVAALGVGGLVTACAYKGLNGLTKKLLISDIKTVFEQGGTKNALGDIIPLNYNGKTHDFLLDFYNDLAQSLKKRFEATDIYAYLKYYSEGYIPVTTVLQNIEKNVGFALDASSKNRTIETIVSCARKDATGGFFGLGKFHLFNGYCKEALELYARIIVARRIVYSRMTHGFPPKSHVEIYELINKNIISGNLLLQV